MDIILGSLEQGLIYALMALGVYLSFRILNFADLSVEGSFPMGAAISALAIVNGLDPFLSLLLAFIGGGIAGLITALLHTKGKIDGLLAGIITMTGLYSINLKIMGTPNLSVFRLDTVFTPINNFESYITDNFTNNEFLLSFTPWFYTIVLVIVIFIIKKLIDWFLQTDLGLSIRATGDNPAMIRSFGVNTNTSIIIGLMLSNALVGLSGGLLAQYQAYSDVQMGIGMIVIGLASVIIGQAIFGTKTIKRASFAVIIGAIIYRFVIALSLYLPWIGPTDMKLITAVIVVLALILPNISSNSKRKRTLSKIASTAEKNVPKSFGKGEI